MRAEKLTQDWVNRTLEFEDVRKYIQGNILPSTRKAVMSYEELLHVTRLCYKLYLWSIGKERGLGNFLGAVKNNDLIGAAHLADEINRVHLWIYPAFIYNIAPSGWKTMMKEE